MNLEYIESYLKLGLIEHKKRLLAELGADISHPNDHPSWALGRIREIESLEELLRDGKKLRARAELILNASRT